MQKTVNPFTDIPYERIAKFFHNKALKNLTVLSSGQGGKGFHFDKQGMWFGAQDYASAPWKVGVNGDFTSTSVDTTVAGLQTQITQNASDIVIEATDRSDADNVLQASITVNANNINLRVSKNDVINQINISSEGILIDADNIKISGSTTFEASWTGAANANPDNWTDVQTWYQTSAPGSAVNGDIWYDTDDGYKMYRYNGASWNAVYETTINGSRLVTGSISAAKMNVGQISAISADLGSITAGTITGGLIRTSASSTRCQISNNSNKFEVYIGGVLYGVLGAHEYTEGAILRIDDNYNGTNNASVWFRNSGTAKLLSLTHSNASGTALYISSANTAIHVPAAGGKSYFYADLYVNNVRGTGGAINLIDSLNMGSQKINGIKYLYISVTHAANPSTGNYALWRNGNDLYWNNTLVATA